jgi:hypothetical protein
MIFLLIKFNFFNTFYMHYKFINALKFKTKLNSITVLEIKSKILHFENYF